MCSSGLIWKLAEFQTGPFWGLLKQRSERLGSSRSGILPIAAQAVHSNFEFLGTIAEAHEAKHPQDDPNSFSTDIFDGANINSLTVIS